MEEKGRGKPGTKFRDIYIYIYICVVAAGMVWLLREEGSGFQWMCVPGGPVFLVSSSP